MSSKAPSLCSTTALQLSTKSPVFIYIKLSIFLRSYVY
jgi:hypothetical protein